MPTTQFVSSTDQGQQLKVNDFIKEPTLIQSVVTNMMNKQFIADEVLRQGPGAPGGAVKFFQDEPLFANGFEVIAEGGEIPVVQGADGTPQVVFTAKGGGALVLTEEVRTRNNIDYVNKRLRQIRNGMVKFWDDRFFAAIFASTMPGYVAPTAWTDSTSKVRLDVAKAAEVSMEQVDANGNEFGFTPDTLIVHPLRASALVYNDDVKSVFQGNIANLNPYYIGDTGRDLGGFRLLKSWRCPQNKAVLLEKKTIGFISDERPLRTTPMYEQRERETHRADTTRMSAVGIDAPKAGVILTGV